MIVRTWILAGALLTLAAGCGPNFSDSGTSEGAYSGLSIAPSADGYHLTLDAAALDRTFLLAPAIAKGPPLAISTAYPARVVKFEVKNERLYLFEDTSAGVVATASLPAHRLLAQFDVIAGKDGGPYTIDFIGGINDFLVQMIAEYGDLGGDEGTPVPDYILSSAVNKAYVRGADLYVDQIIEMHQSGGKAAPPVVGQVKYTLSPYAENTAFPKRSNSAASFAKVGFFENKAPFTDKDGYDTYFINKWDVQKPIVFHVPTTVPDDFKAAVRDGILYWNKVFGHDYVQVADLPDGVTPHEPGYNVVQWLDTAALDFAYADWTSDPRTGETRQAQIFIPSSFAIASRDDALRVLTNEHLDAFAALDYRKKPQSALALMRAGERRGNAAACYAGMRAEYGQALAQLLLTTGADDDAVKRFAQDVIRQVVAHEIGHTLGLRHNFRAKTGATIPPADLINDVANYMTTGNPPSGQTITTSVMDYLPAEYNALSGAMIRLGAGPFKYDTAALAWGYTGVDHRTLDFGGFCSDEREGNFPDCVRFATPGPAIQGAFAAFGNMAQAAVADLALRFLNAKAPPDHTPPLPVEEVELDPAATAKAAVSPLHYLASMLRDFKEINASWLGVIDGFKYTGDLNREEELAATLKLQTDAVTAAGGVEALFKPLIPVARDDKTFMPGALAGIEAQLAAETAAAGFAGFTDAEKSYINGVTAPYFKLMAEELLADAIGTLTAVDKGKFAGFDPAGLSAQLKALATAVLTAEAAEPVTGKADGADVSASAPYYRHELLMAATGLLSSDLYDAFPDTFNAAAGVDVLKTLQDRFDAVTQHGTIPPSKLEGPIKKWALELNEVIQALPNTTPAP